MRDERGAVTKNLQLSVLALPRFARVLVSWVLVFALSFAVAPDRDLHVAVMTAMPKADVQAAVAHDAEQIESGEVLSV